MPKFCVDMIELSKTHLPLPDKDIVVNSILKTNSDGFAVWLDSKLGVTVVQCKNKPEDILLNNWIWKEIDESGN